MALKIGVSALAISFLFAGTADAATIDLFSNFGPGFSYTGGNQGLGTAAVEFTSPVNALFVEAVIPLATFGTGVVDQLTVDLQADASGEPSGVNLDSITVTVPSSFPGSLVTATSSLYPELTAGTSYWLVLDYTYPDFYGGIAWYTGGTGSTAPFAVDYSGGSSGPWYLGYSGSFAPAFEIDGSATPEPGSMALIGAGLFVLGLGIRLRPSLF